MDTRKYGKDPFVCLTEVQLMMAEEAIFVVDYLTT
jgi:hypothetical protein